MCLSMKSLLNSSGVLLEVLLHDLHRQCVRLVGIFRDVVFLGAPL